MSEVLEVTVEVAGCLTTCMHCWARGKHYESMPLADIELVLGQARGFCREHGFEFYPYPMHEVLAHPDAPGVLELFHEFSSGNGSLFEAIPTGGVPLALREDWQKVLETAEKVGTTVLWFTFHGVGEVHDRAVNRRGAYQETCLAVERARSAGLRAGCNIFVTKDNVGQFYELADQLERMGVDQRSCEVAGYHPIARIRHSEPSRPELDDLVPLASKVLDISLFHRDFWENLEGHTEAAYVAKALGKSGMEKEDWNPAVSRLRLVCRPTLELRSGAAGLYGPLHGDLRQNDTSRLFWKAVKCGPFSDGQLYFSADVFPSVQTLAEEFGDPYAEKMYFSASDMRLRWLDLALPECRKY